MSKIKTNTCPWMTYDLWKLIQKRNRILKKCKQNANNTLVGDKLKIINKQIGSVKYFAKKNYYDNMFINVNQKVLWNKIKEFFNGDKPKPSVNIIKLGDNVYNTSVDIANIMNQYFVDIGKTLCDSLDSDGNIHKFQTMRSIPNSLFLSSTDYNEVFNVISLLDNSKSCGIDNITSIVLKRNIVFFSEFLCNLINTIFKTGIYPCCLKIAKVIPLLKNGDKTLVYNYRPISILSVFDKVVEKILAARLVNFFNHSKVFYSFQYGFRKGAGTEVALVEISNMLYSSFNRKECVGALFLDLHKAFDTIDHELLMEKLFCYGIRGIAYNLIKSYLHNRKQLVMLDGTKSTILNINCGVPQGSVLGPLLFLIFIDDISKLPLIGDIRIFADDTAIFYATKDPSTIINNMMNDMIILLDYFKSNKIALNLSKTKYMIFHSPYKLMDSLSSLIINDIVVERVNSFKYLGVIFDQHLSWNEHIISLCKKLTPYMGLLKKLSYYVPKYVLKLMYYAYIHPRLLYGIIIYGSAAVSKLKPLQVIQSKSIKAACKLPLLFPTQQLYEIEAEGILPIRALHDFQIAFYMYKITKTSEILSNITFTYVNHKHFTRSTKNIVGGTISNEYGRKSIRFTGPSIFNNLPDCIKTSTSIYTFKKSLKAYFLNDIGNYIC